MPRWLCSPAFLFAAGLIQALLPYVYWQVNGVNASYTYDISYFPAIIWVIGFLFFWLGTFFIGRENLSAQIIEIRDGDEVRTGRVVVVMLVVSVIGISSVIGGVYGGIPVISYLQGMSEVYAVNQAQTLAPSGQLGFVLACSFSLTMALVAYLGCARVVTLGRKTLVLIAVLVVVFQATMAGKRQGLMMLIVTIGCGFVLLGRHPGQQLAGFLGLDARNRTLGHILLVLIFAGAFFSFGFLALIRSNQGSHMSPFETAIDQVFVYLQLPLINFEVQAAHATWGPGSDNGWGPLMNFMPHKMQQEYLGDQSAIGLAPRAEPGIGAGFFGDLHWFWGLSGVISFSLLCGAFCQWLYVKSKGSILALAIYSHLAWTLVAAHSYNHFLMLVYGVLPVGLFLAAMGFVGGWDFSRRVVLGTRKIKAGSWIG